MCGITGLKLFQSDLIPSHQKEIEHCLDWMKNRGPDAQGQIQVSPTTLMGGNRLRITDAHNSKADLPYTHDQRWTVVFNGQIYNHLDIRKSLKFSDWQTQSDTETLVVAYTEKGKDCLDVFEGMFAFAIYDAKDDSLFLARDPSGQKPLYYSYDTDHFIFASDIQALISNPYRSYEFCKRGLLEYITQRFIIGADTHIKGIKKLESGCCLMINNDGKQDHQRYYKLPIVSEPRKDEKALITELSDCIDDAIYETLASEHDKTALYLSGGIDSTGVLSRLTDYGQTPETYSIGFEYFKGENYGIKSTFDEFEYSDIASEHYGTKHHKYKISQQEYVDIIDDWCEIMGEPLDANEAPLLLLMARYIKETRCRIIYSGSGVDEIFDGYGLNFAIPQNKDNIVAFYHDEFAWNFNVDLNRLTNGEYREVRDYVIGKHQANVDLYGDIHPYHQTQVLNFHGRMNVYEFREMDVTAMSCGIETRSPMINKRIIEKAFSYEPALNNKNNQRKWLYTQSWKGRVPDPIYKRRKVGFPTPVEFWYNDVFRGVVKNTVKKGCLLNQLGILDWDYVDFILQSDDPKIETLSYRFYCLEKQLQFQMPLMASSQSH